MNEIEYLDTLKDERGYAFAGGVQIGAAMSALIGMASSAEEGQLPDLIKAAERVFVITMTTYCETHEIDHVEMQAEITKLLVQARLIIGAKNHGAVN